MHSCINLVHIIIHTMLLSFTCIYFCLLEEWRVILCMYFRSTNLYRNCSVLLPCGGEVNFWPYCFRRLTCCACIQWSVSFTAILCSCKATGELGVLVVTECLKDVSIMIKFLYLLFDIPRRLCLRMKTPQKSNNVHQQWCKSAQNSILPQYYYHTLRSGC